MHNDTALRFRRQFICSPAPIEGFHAWPKAEIGSEPLHIYAHPTLEFTRIESSDGGMRVVLLGYVVDPEHPELGNASIVKRLLDSCNTFEEFVRRAADLAGRFVFFADVAGGLYIFHDPGGLRTTYFSFNAGCPIIGSQPGILAEAMEMEPSECWHRFMGSSYRETAREPWLPSNVALYEGVERLLPNHYLDVTARRQVRYWPWRSLESHTPDDGARRGTAQLEALISAAQRRYPLALPMTAGWDSRTLLAASRGVAEEIYFYTLLYRDLTPASTDVAIPTSILESVGLKNHLIECRGESDPVLLDIYERNVDQVHVGDWASIAAGMFDEYPQERMCLKGNSSEIARCFYFPYGRPTKTTVDTLVELESGWTELPFVREALNRWLNAAAPACDESGLHVIDLFYWEHRIGSWQAQSQLEWDLVQEAFTPFSHRPLLEILLGTPESYRRKPDYRLYRMMIERMWPEIGVWPINPLSLQGKFKEFVKAALDRFGAGTLRPRWSKRL